MPTTPCGPRYAVIALMLLLLDPSVAYSQAAEATIASTDSVRTIAGEGAAGYADGPASSATFVMPTALAFGPSNELYIADQGSQRIRMLRDGFVSTIAGSGDDVASDRRVSGGYLDGPALRARFDEPSGIAVGSRGELYVSDRKNHCIRRIERGIVDTFGGNASTAGAADGRRSQATFMLPTAITIDSSGNLYVADFGAGIRKISSDGTVTTLKLDKTRPNRFIGISAYTGPDDTTIFATLSNGRYIRFSAATGLTEQFGKFVESSIETHPWGIAAIGPEEFVATDVDANVIRLYRLRQAPFLSHVGGEPIAGVARVRGRDGAGYVDGPAPDARFDLPSAVAIRNGTVVIAEAGNRRIRSMPLPDARGPIGNDFDELTKDPAHYRILLAGASFTFWATTWAHSIPGELEARLAADRATIGLPKPPRISVARLDGSSPEVAATFVSEFAGDGQVDLVLVMANECRIEPQTAAVFAALQKQLAQSGGRLFIFAFSEGKCLSNVEWFANVQTTGSPTKCIKNVENAETTLKAAAVPYYLMDADLQAYEASDPRLPFYPAHATPHPTNAGYAVITNLLAKELEARRPWGE